MKLTRTIAIELAERKAGAKTFPAVISTEAPVKRRDWERGEFDEVLSHKAGAVDLSRAPLPLLESHDRHRLPIGTVENLRIVDRKLRGDVRFGESARAKEIAADVEAGVVRNLSVGYSIESAAEKKTGKRTTLTATRWTPHEASAVSVGADAGAGFNRAARSETMPDENAQETETRETIDLHERQRCGGIARIGRALGVPELAERHIADGTSLDDFRALAIDQYGSRNLTPISVAGRPDVRAGDYDALRGSRRPIEHAPWLQASQAPLATGDDFRAAAADAILLRAGVRINTPHPAAGDIDASVRGLARTCLSRQGKTVSGGDDRLLKRVMSTSDFPLILADAMHKATLIGYETEPASHREWVRPQQVSDFRDQNRVILGSAPGLEQVNEGGEYTFGALDEDATSYRVAKYGKVVSLTWEILKNDSLGTFMRVQPAMGQAARRKEADTVYALLAENSGAGPTMQDDTALFHADHANLVTAGTFDAALLGAGRALLRKQTALGGGYLSLVPTFLLVPAELETDAEILLAKATKHIELTGAGTDDGAGNTTSSKFGTVSTPKWLSGLTLVVEPRLAADVTYLAADNAQIDTVELGLLDENIGGPVIEEEKEFVRDVYRWKVRHVFGAKALDWRGLVKMPIS